MQWLEGNQFLECDQESNESGVKGYRDASVQGEKECNGCMGYKNWNNRNVICYDNKRKMCKKGIVNVF